MAAATRDDSEAQDLSMGILLGLGALLLLLWLGSFLLKSWAKRGDKHLGD